MSDRLALQCTAELWRGLDVLDRELKLGQFNSARDTVEMLRVCVKLTDALLVDYLRNAEAALPAELALEQAPR